MKHEPQIAVRARWAVADDGRQWILQRRVGDQWQSISFVRSTKAVLARCLKEAGATPAETNAILDPLPERHPTCSEGYGVRFPLRDGSRALSGEINAAIPKVIAGPADGYTTQSLQAAAMPLDPDTAASQRQANDWDRIRQEIAWAKRAHDSKVETAQPIVAGSPYLDQMIPGDLSIPEFLRRVQSPS